MSEISDIRYPDIIVKESSIDVGVFTTLRKYHEGKWYLWEFVKKTYVEHLDRNQVIAEREHLLNQLHEEVYMTIILGVVQPELISHQGLIYRLDPNQESEEDRLKNRFPHLK